MMEPTIPEPAMNRLLAATVTALVLSTSPGLALSAIEAADRDLWCGLALELVVTERPADSAIEPAVLARLTAGAEQLLARGASSYLELGYSERVVEAKREELAQRVEAQLGTALKDEPFSYEECRTLL